MIALHQVRTVALTGYFEVTRFLGLDPYALLAEAGLSPSLLDDPETRVPGHQVVRLLEETDRRSACSSFGLLMAECRTFESLGPITLLLEHLGSVRETLELTSRYRRHFNDIVDVHVEDGDPALIQVGILPQFASRPVIEMTVALAQTMLAGASRRTWRPSVVHFRHSAPSDTSLYRRFFPAPVQFESSFDGFECPRMELDAPWPWARKTMTDHAEKLLQMVEISPEDSLMSDSVMRALALMLPSGRATLPAISTALGSNSRSLQRALEREGTTFVELLNKGRRELALRYLSNGSQSVTSVAELTGYSSISAFGRWFGSEFGVSPREWRERQLNGRASRAA